MSSRLGAQGKLPTIFTVAVLVSFGLVGLGSLGGCGVLSRPPDLTAQIAAARTPADHAAIAHALLAQASPYATAAAYHRSLAAKYENLAGPDAQYRSYDRSDVRMAGHCRRVAEDLERAPAISRGSRANMSGSPTCCSESSNDTLSV